MTTPNPVLPTPTVTGRERLVPRQRRSRTATPKATSRLHPLGQFPHTPTLDAHLAAQSGPVDLLQDRTALGLEAVDLFCGAGGSSLGLTQAGLQVAVAVNHWETACASHTANIAGSRAIQANISVLDMRALPSVPVLSGSPECTNHSLAKNYRKARTGDATFFGARESEERSRATMWDIPRYLEAHGVAGTGATKVAILENVLEARSLWAPYEGWKIALRALGYTAHEVHFNSAFAGVPQWRNRMYIVLVADGHPMPDLDLRPNAPCTGCGVDVGGIQTWKNPDRPYGKYGISYYYRCPHCSAVVAPYTTPGAAAIDTSIPLKSVRTGINSGNTRRRIAQGIERGLHTQQLAAPIGTWQDGQVTRGAAGGSFISEMYGTSSARPLSQPLCTVTAGGWKHMLVTPAHRPDGSVDPDVNTAGYRMLGISELTAAMGFPPDYQLAGDVEDQRTQLGNGVTPAVMRLLAGRVADTFAAGAARAARRRARAA